MIRGAAVLLVLAVALLAPATLGGKVMSASDLPLASAPFASGGPVGQNPLQFDSGYVFEPDGLQVRGALRDGRLPTWTPWLSAGRPLLAAQQSAPLFPLTWIGAVFPYWESQAWIAVLKLLIVGLGTAVLGRMLGLRAGPALLGGIAFALGSYLVDWLMHPHANAYVLLPWLFAAAERLCRTGTLRAAAALAAVFGLAWLGGQPESAFLVTVAAGAWVVHRRGSWRSAALAAGALLLGVALAAVMLLPLLEALRESGSTSRSGPPLPLKAAAAIVFPEYWGRPDRAGEIPGPVNFTERTLYVGVLPALLAAAGLVARRPRGPQLFFAVLAAVALLVSFDTGPVADVVYDLPVLDRISVSRALVLAAFAIALLAAFGLERWLDGTAAERRRMLIAAAVLAALPVLAVMPARVGAIGAAVDQLTGDGAQGADGVTLAAGLRWLVLAAASLALLAAARRPRAWLAPAACALAAVDLLWMGWGFNPAIDKAQADPPQPPPVAAMRDLTAGGRRVVGIGGLEPNTASRWRLADARGHEQPSVERTVRLWHALGGGATASTEAVAPAEPRNPRLLDAFGVRAVLVDRSVQVPSLRADPIVYDGPGGFVLDHRTALPPAFVAYGWRRAATVDDALFGVALGTTAQARDAPVIETRDDPPPGAPPATPATVTARTDTSVIVEVQAQQAGRLVLLDTFYPGWEATVDGRPAAIEAANVAFRAAAVGPGRHEVRFEYRPSSVRAGAIVSVAALILLLAMSFARRRGPR